MYITNPTKEQLRKWYRCSKRVGDYLMVQKGISPIYRTNKKYYFARTEALTNALRNASIFITIIAPKL